MNQANSRTLRWMGISIFLYLIAGLCFSDAFEQEFKNPSKEYAPWVYWFWSNGNITKEGLTADLEAMKRVGIGGVLIMEVDQGAPVGPVDFGGKEWREMFAHAVREAARLGIEINMNNDAGWNGSGGPWITPEQSMQKVVWTETEVKGPIAFRGILPQPETVAGYYQDITVMAVPKVEDYRIKDIHAKSMVVLGNISPISTEPLERAQRIDPEMIVMLDGHMDKNGELIWDVPEGEWTILRFGHTSTGAMNAPAPLTGRGLECNKLSKAGIEANFAGLIQNLVNDSKALVSKSFIATHIDSWENGSQNWTEAMREEFQKRCGYDLFSYMPVLTGRVVQNDELSERFLWDLRRVVSQLVVENYAGHMRELASNQGLRFTVEAYGSPCDYLPYAGMSDEPMGEFWIGGMAMESCRWMSSAGHIYGKPIIGAEAFTAGFDERWRMHPGSIKSLGDRAFSFGINRFVFHRYAMQPWVTDVRPGMMMGPWGIHYERTQTWWEQSQRWHTYLARCQYMLRQGLFVADIAYLQPETSPNAPAIFQLNGYGWDVIHPTALIERMSVKNGRLVLPDGMSYAVLVLPQIDAMTPELLTKIRDLIKEGATVIGAPPKRAPGLTNYPQCDQQVEQLVQEIWGPQLGESMSSHQVGKGTIYYETSPKTWLATNLEPDIISAHKLNTLHRQTQDADIYFVANPKGYPIEATVAFRMKGRIPEIWYPETGAIEQAVAYEFSENTVRVHLAFDENESVFVVFRKYDRERFLPVQKVLFNDEVVLATSSDVDKDTTISAITIDSAKYGVLSDPDRTLDVKGALQHLINMGERDFFVSRMAEQRDPAFGVIKTLMVEYTLPNGEKHTWQGVDSEIVDLVYELSKRPIFRFEPLDEGIRVIASKEGRYTLVSDNESVIYEQPTLPEPIDLDQQWTVQFGPKLGAPEQLSLDRLMPLNEHADLGVKYYSGMMTYRKTFSLPESSVNQRLILDLGNVQVMAEVIVNGKRFEWMWKSPFQLDVTDAIKPGENQLEVNVVNLWVNRIIGDEFLPEDSERNADGTLKAWPKWLEDGQPSPTGRLTFCMWRILSKDDPLVPSGLIGPVKLTAWGVSEPLMKAPR